MSGLSRARKPVIVEEIRRTKLTELLLEGRRLDSRGLTDYRPIKIEVGPIERANGSALTQIGNTQVIVGVKAGLGAPFPDRPGEGVLMVNAEVLPLASPYTEPGPPDENSIELARVVDRGIRESGMVDLGKLCIIPGRQVYTLYVDVNVLNVDGNLFDASSYAAVVAIATANLPTYRVAGDGRVEATGETMPVPITNIPVSVTMARIGDAIIADPSAEEEAVMDARLTLVVDGAGRLCAGQKGHGGYWPPEQIMEAARLAMRKAEENRRILAEAVGRVREVPR
jgi:exosome complex component RRP42